MYAPWKSFLEERGVRFEDGSLVEPVDGPVTPEYFCDLAHLGIISLSGTDASAFLQGQFTNDLSTVSPTRSQLSAWCSPKGRVLATFRVLASDNGYWLVLPRDLIPVITQRLRLYILRADVQLEDLSNGDLVCMGCQGENTTQWLDEILATPPGEVDAVVYDQNSGIRMVRSSGSCRYELFGRAASMMQLWDQLTPKAVMRGAGIWALADILAGIPNVTSVQSDQYLPQMLNLQAIDAMSFEKGCYAGQEIVARTHFLGRLKRRMYLCSLDSDEPPSPGVKVVVAGAENPQPVGTLLNIQPTGGTRHAALAVLNIEAATRDAERLEAPLGTALSLLPLPYALTAEATHQSQ